MQFTFKYFVVACKKLVFFLESKYSVFDLQDLLLKFLNSELMIRMFFWIFCAKNTDSISVISKLKGIYIEGIDDFELANLPGERSLQTTNGGYLDGEINRINGIQKMYPNLVRVPVTKNVIEGMVFSSGLVFKVDGWQSLEPYHTIHLQVHTS